MIQGLAATNSDLKRNRGAELIPAYRHFSYPIPHSQNHYRNYGTVPLFLKTPYKEEGIALIMASNNGVVKVR